MGFAQGYFNKFMGGKNYDRNVKKEGYVLADGFGGTGERRIDVGKR